MRHFTHEQKKTFDKIAIVILALLCVASIFWFIVTFRKIYSDGGLRSDYQMQRRQYAVHPSPTLIPIYTWMTFNYLNVVFKLPPSYLQQQLDITDKYYPNVRIDTYAKQNDLNAQTYLLLVQQTISRYSPASQ